MEVKFWDFKLAEYSLKWWRYQKECNLEKMIMKDPFKDLKTANISRKGRETDEGGWERAVWEV